MVKGAPLIDTAFQNDRRRQPSTTGTFPEGTPSLRSVAFRWSVTFGRTTGTPSHNDRRTVPQNLKCTL